MPLREGIDYTLEKPPPGISVDATPDVAPTISTSPINYIGIVFCLVCLIAYTCIILATVRKYGILCGMAVMVMIPITALLWKCVLSG